VNQVVEHLPCKHEEALSTPYPKERRDMRELTMRRSLSTHQEKCPHQTLDLLDP
jgi:hypothetical protein